MNVALILLLSSHLFSCGGGGGSSTNNSEDIIEEPTTEEPVVDEPILDHSGLTPLTTNSILEQEYLAGGDATVFVSDKDAFGTRPDMILNDFQKDGFFTAGDHLFRTKHSDIGPILNNPVCQNCHISDGKGQLPATINDPMLTMLFKLGDANGAPDPIYGDQLQPFSLDSFDGGDVTAGLSVHNGSINGDVLYGEAYPYVEFETVAGTYPDGTTYELRKPIYSIRDLSYGPFMEDIRFSPRLSPAVFGTGLLEAIPQEHILALVDEADADGDGISGRASMVIDTATGETTLGRFAYKAQNASILQQASAAYQGDMGLTTSVFTAEPCTENQEACNFAAESELKVGEDVDVTDYELALVEFYNRVLGVPARRGYDAASDIWDADVAAGRTLFFEANCTGCHTPRHITEDAEGSVLGELSLLGLEENAEPIEVLSNQTLFPYTDLLLHDMGGSCEVSRETADGMSCTEGESCLYVQRCEGLADDLVQGDASGSEWKTPALWGIGLTKVVNPNATFLHDGRARTIEEAILWHDGEAAASKLYFMNLSQEEREQVLSFIRSL